MEEQFIVCDLDHDEQKHEIAIKPGIELKDIHT